MLLVQGHYGVLDRSRDFFQRYIRKWAGSGPCAKAMPMPIARVHLLERRSSSSLKLEDREGFRYKSWQSYYLTVGGLMPTKGVGVPNR